MNPQLLPALIAVAVLALVHLLAGKLKFLDVTPRSIWLSGSSGISVAYVFVHLLPELAEGQRAVAEATETGLLPQALRFVEHHVYLVALMGMAAFYGLEQIARRSRSHLREEQDTETASVGVFYLHIGSFAIYNALIGYLMLHRNEDGLSGLLFFFVAYAFHFVVNDYGLRQHHRRDYERVGRWLLAGAVVLGGAVGLAATLSEAALAVAFAFIAGGTILNVLKEELPEDRESRFWAFALGTACYTVLLLAL